MLLAKEALLTHAAGRPAAITVGVFDGVHLGHRFLIDALKARAAERGLASAVVTLHPSPVQVLRPEVRVAYISSLEERIELLEGTGVDAVAPLTFTSELAELSAADFLGLLHQTLDMRYMLMGHDNAFGRAREGTPARVAEIGESMGFEVEVLSSMLDNGFGRVSATAIRQALARGEMEVVEHLLGRPFSLRGPIVHGHDRGHRIGFPTANMAVTPDRALPAYGVYITRAYAGGRVYGAATNIGINPTFNDKVPAVETYILDFEGNLYERELRIEVLHRLRGELRFGDIELLKQAIAADVEEARRYFAERS